MMIIHNLQQGSEEWFAVRSDKATASHGQAIATAGKGLETYITELMASHYSSAEKEHYTNKDIERGIELEDEAIAIYELETGNKCLKEGFCEFNNYIGCSVDRLVNENGLAEVKCPSDKVYFKYMLDGKIDTKYLWQMKMQMLVRGKEWNDYVVYNPNFTPSIIIERVYLDDVSRDKLLNGFKKAEELIKNIKLKMKG